MRPQGIYKEYVKLRAFSFSLDDYAKDWLFYLPPGSITSWASMIRVFLSKYFPTSKTIGIRREISGIKQRDSKELYEYWERFKRLCTRYSQHDISDKSFIEYFYGGFLPSERKFIDAACGGSIEDKTPQAIRDLISTMAAASKQYRDQRQLPRRVNEVRQAQQNQQVRPYGIYATVGHPIDLCPSLQEEDQQVNAVGGFNGQQRYDPYSNTYNPGWKEYPNFSYDRKNQYQNYQQRNSTQAASQKSNMPLEEIIKSLANTVQNLEQQINQVATSVNKLEL
ncbi:uncharacterized protein LOC110627535 [Manihot esculenta]|uniref:uncharacterized protein LOC110627535 n=1 Tax=Manihot esculenta TaxID=3983 RepID=UPI000B5D4CE5|nr:uncharacterized protein LOC110627535 [Manihot esculenta]